MTRQLRYVGSGSGNDGCPTLYELPSGDYLVQGDRVTDSGEIAQLRYLKPTEGAVTVPRALLANFGPKTAEHEPQMISLGEFGHMFTTFRHSAWRLETRRRYASDESTETYAEFLRTGRVDWDTNDAWCENRKRQVAAGKRVERVRLLDDRPTTGQRYLLDNARRNAEVGETIRTLPRAVADELALPAADFWIFDARVVALLHFDDADAMTGVELITTPVDVNRYLQAREAAWHYAVPYDQAT